MSADAIVREVAAAVGLAEGEAGVRDVIAVVGRSGSASTRAITRATGLPVPIVAAIAGELRKRGVVARDRPTRLTPSGRGLFGGGAPKPELACRCHACMGRGFVVPSPLAALVAELAAAAEDAPPARTELDQSHCTAETKLLRALVLEEAGALEGKRILLLGDDDLTSVAIYRLAVHLGVGNTIRELAVVDVDPLVLTYVGRQLRGAPFRVRRIEHDLRRPLPTALTRRFDTVLTDPPYTPEGAELFLSRAATALAPGYGGSVFLAFGPKPPAESLRIQQAITQMGFVIRGIARNFNEYAHAGMIGGTSHLFHLTSAGEPRPLVLADYRGRLYTGDSRAPRRYRCASCDTTQLVGRDSRWATVAQLKAAGCPECGGAGFKPLRRLRPRSARAGRSGGAHPGFGTP